MKLIEMEMKIFCGGYQWHHVYQYIILSIIPLPAPPVLRSVRGNTSLSEANFYKQCASAGPQAVNKLILLFGGASVSVVNMQRGQFLPIPHYKSDVGCGFSIERLDSESSPFTHLLYFKRKSRLLYADFINVYLISMHRLKHSLIQVYLAQLTDNLSLLHLG